MTADDSDAPSWRIYNDKLKAILEPEYTRYLGWQKSLFVSQLFSRRLSEDPANKFAAIKSNHRPPSIKSRLRGGYSSSV
jgi:hypothetical protein